MVLQSNSVLSSAHLFFFSSPPRCHFSKERECGEKKKSSINLCAIWATDRCCDAKWLTQSVLAQNNYNLWGQTLRFITDHAFSGGHDTSLLGIAFPSLALLRPNPIEGWYLNTCYCLRWCRSVMALTCPDVDKWSFMWHAEDVSQTPLGHPYGYGSILL